MAILNKGQTFSDGEQVTSTKLNTAVDGATFAAGAVDDVSTQLSGGGIIVKDGGVTTAKIADDGVTPAKLSAGAPTWDTNGVHSLPSNGTNGAVGLELNYGVSGSGSAFIDFHSTDATNPDNDARIIKYPGSNSDFVFENAGTGNTVFFQNGAEAMRIDNNGHITGAFVSAYPVGSIYMNASNSTNPSTLLGFGTWVSFGAGRVLVGIDGSQSEFNSIGETGGSKTHTLTTSEMPSHDHNAKAYGNGQGSVGSGYLGVADTTSINGQGRQSIDHEGGGQAHNNLQPYIVVYMWQRTA